MITDVPTLPADSPRLRLVRSFAELAGAPWAGGVNALCWPRQLEGDFAEIVRLLEPERGITGVDDDDLLALPLSPAGQRAREVILTDLHRLREGGAAPELNIVDGYLNHDADELETVPTHVQSWHVDSATGPADTWLCTYLGASSEGVANEHAVRRIDVPETRAELLQSFGGADDDAFREHLAEHCYDLHYDLLPGARPWTFGVGHLWRIATQHPGCAVPPCIHRAPATVPGSPRLLLIA